LGFNSGGVAALAQYIPDGLRGNPNLLWLVISLFVLLRVSKIFKGNLFQKVSKMVRVLLIDSRGINKSEIEAMLSPEFITYIWCILSSCSKGQQQKTGPQAKDFRLSYSEKFRLVMERFKTIKKDDQICYTSEAMLGVMRLGNSKPKNPNVEPDNLDEEDEFEGFVTMEKVHFREDESIVV
jgi:hypothetical protein